MESDGKSSVAGRICDYAGRFRPNKVNLKNSFHQQICEIDTVTRVLRVAGVYVDQQVVNHFVKLLPTSAPDLHQYAVLDIFNIVRIEGEKSWIQEGLLQAMLWSVGEYGVY